MKSEGQYFRKIARGSALALSGKVLTYPIGLVLAIALARILDPRELGGYFMATSLILIGATVVQFGAGPVMVKFVAAALSSNDPGRARGTLILGFRWLAASSLVAVLLLHFGPGHWLLDSLREGDVLAGSLTAIALMVVAYAAIAFFCEALRSFSDLGTASFFAEQLLQRILLLAALAGVWVLGLALDLRGVLFLMLASAGATALLGLLFVWLRFRRLDRQATRPVSPGELLRQAPPFFFMRLNFWLMDTGPIWVLGMFYPAEIVALYGVGNLLALIVLAPLTVVNTSLGPAVVKFHTEEKPELLRMMLGTVAGVATLGAFSVVLILLLFGKQILTVVFTENLAGAYATTVILGVGRGISVLFGAPALLLSMTHHQMTVFRVLLTSSGLGFVLYFAAAYFGGIEWVAATAGALAISQAAILSYFSKAFLGMSTFPSFRIRDWGDMRRQFGHRP